jgi:DNA-binding response OmpR family regulator
VTATTDGAEALERFDSDGFDLVVLDVMMPRLDGFSVCREIRKRSNVPIIMLTALGSPDDVVRGFNLGADDYITKPFTFREVQARIHAILRRVRWAEEKHAPQIIAIGRIAVDMEAHEVLVATRRVQLTPIEFRLLYTLMTQAGKAISKEDLMREVWGYEFMGGTNLVEVTVRRLREKVEDDPSHPEHILTVRGVGYKFRAPD